MTSLLLDLRQAARTLWTSPGLVLVSVLSLGLGYGVNLTLFSAVREVFFHLPTVQDPERLVGVEPGNSNQFSYLNLCDLDEAGIFEAVVGFRRVSLNMRAGGEAARVDALAVTANFFESLGVTPAQGRTFSGSDAAPEQQPRTAVISAGFKRRAFADDPGVVGRTVVLNGEAFDVVAVLPDDYKPVTAFARFDVYVPLSSLVLPTLADRSNGNALGVIARLVPGMTREQAQAAVTVFGGRLEERYPTENMGMGEPATVLSMATREFGGWQEPAFISGVLFVLVGLVLLSACANVAGLLLARASLRQRELAVRVALGARRGRLVRMLLVESMSLACLGAIGGGVVFLWFTRVLQTIALPMGSVELDLNPDATVGLYAVALTIATGVLCGVMPALRSTRANVVTELKSGDMRGSTGRLRMRHAFVIGQVAVSLMLVVLSSLLLRSLMRVTTLDPGFDVDRVAVAMVHVNATGYLADGGLPLGERLVERLEALPGIESASFANIVALGTDQSAARPEVDGTGTTGPGARTFLNSVSPRYFATLGIPFVSGRDFDTRDRVGSPPVAIVSEAFVGAYFDGQNALGRQVRRSPRDPWAEIVGVVRDSKYGSIAEAPTPLLYMAYTQSPRVSSQVRPLVMHARTDGNVAELVTTLRRLIGEVEPDVAADIAPLGEATGAEANLRQLGTRLIGAIGAVALLLAMVGLYGVMAFVVSSRTPEIGTRMALGASAGRILRGVLGQGLRLILVGVGVGALGAWLVARALVAALAGVSPADPLAFGGAASVLLLVGLAACYVPARRAASLDPVVALRVD